MPLENKFYIKKMRLNQKIYILESISKLMITYYFIRGKGFEE